jgi:hypothetical protein
VRRASRVDDQPKPLDGWASESRMEDFKARERRRGVEKWEGIPECKTQCERVKAKVSIVSKHRRGREDQRRRMLLDTCVYDSRILPTIHIHRRSIPSQIDGYAPAHTHSAPAHISHTCRYLPHMFISLGLVSPTLRCAIPCCHTSLRMKIVLPDRRDLQ